MTIPHRAIGGDGPEISLLSLGSWHTYDRMRFEDAVAMLRLAVDSGINFFDVGRYGGFPIGDGTFAPEGFTDVLFGRMMQAAGVPREDYLISAKLWLMSLDEAPLGPQLDGLLFRLGTDHADFTILGDIWYEGLDMRQLVGQLGELIESGKLRGWGVNNWSVRDLRAAHEAAVSLGLPGPRMAQLKYSIIRRSIADGEPFNELCEQTGITLQASDVMEGGILAGKVNPARAIGQDPGGIQAAAKDVAGRLAELSADFGATPAQVAIAFCLTNPHITTVLFGATSVKQLTDNMAAVELAERRGPELRAAVADLWLDRDLIDPSGDKPYKPPMG
jgi:aryl-alcohol dehydrogenase-like predicted oxidoreductase